MRRALSIICIIFLLGITTAIPYYSCSYFVYADENEPLLTEDQIIDAGLSVYLNARNGFITIADGTIQDAKFLMNEYIETFMAYYNINHGIQEGISKQSLVENILVKHNPFRVQLKGFAVQFFNDLYDYLEDKGKVDNAKNSNGGDTTDNLYSGKRIGNSLFYIYNSNGSDPDNYGSKFLNESELLAHGTCVDAFSGQYALTVFNNKNPNANWNNTWITIDEMPSISIHYSANTTYTGVLTSLEYGSSSGNPTPSLTVRFTHSYLYCTRNYKVWGEAAWIIDRYYPNKLFYGVASHDYTRNGYWLFKFGSVDISTEQSNMTNSSVNFETQDFNKNSTDIPESGKELQYTPKNNTTNETFNTYNEYINNYVIKNTKIIKKVINEGDSGEDEPTQPSTNNPYPLDPTDPSAPTGGTVPDWTGNSDSGVITPDGNGGYTFDLPDFSLPDLDIDWSISGLSEKFPFSIPFDLLAFFTVLNAEPETPAIQATIPLGLWEWEIDWDLHNFDNLAELLRTLEFIGFCIGLALITRNIIKG